MKHDTKKLMKTTPVHRWSVVACVWVILLLLTLPSCQEDTIQPDVFGALFGEVVLAGNNAEGITDARVTTNPPTNTLFSDEFGRFGYESIKEGTYTVRVEKDGFITQLESVTINEDKTTNIVIKLSPDTLQNTSPSAPFNPMPMDGTTDLDLSLTLSWEATDIDTADQLTYDVILFNSDMSQSQVLASGLTDNFINLNDLAFGNTYYWQVIVSDGRAEAVNGAVWQFSTMPFPDLRYLYTRNLNGNYQIYASDGNGTEIQLTEGSNSNWRPLMSPNREKIAYISNAGIEPQLYLMNRDGSDQKQLTTLPISGFNNLELDFCWSPDGTELLYMNNSRLFRIRTDGTGLKQLATAPSGFNFTECDWTEQNDHILVRLTGTSIYQSFIVLYNSDGLFLQQVENDAPGALGGPVFSIDGQYMLFTRDVSEFENTEGRQLDSRIFLKNLNTFQLLDLSLTKPNGTNDLDARFSPDGARVIFVNTNNDGISSRDVYSMRVDGEDRTLLFEGAEMPEWR